MTSNSTIAKRLWLYQKERFPLLAHGILIASFTFSAMAYSHICRNAIESIHIISFFKALTNTFLLFLLLRISDEFKDKEFDALHRPHLPVPRGLVKLSELKWVGIIILSFLILFNAIFATQHLTIFVFVLFYGSLMFKEFFIKHWLEKNQLFYVASHMMIIPLVDTMASSFDWIGQEPNVCGLIWFFAVSFFNGCTLELGRKIKSKENEEANSYSKALGFYKAMLYFQIVVLVTFVLCLGAASYANLAYGHFLVFAILYIVSALFGWYYYRHQTAKNSKLFETISGIWAIGMYLNLGISILL